MSCMVAKSDDGKRGVYTSVQLVSLLRVFLSAKCLRSHTSCSIFVSCRRTAFIWPRSIQNPKGRRSGLLTSIQGAPSNLTVKINFSLPDINQNCSTKKERGWYLSGCNLTKASGRRRTIMQEKRSNTYRHLRVLRVRAQRWKTRRGY